MPDRRRYGRTPDTICLLASLALAGTALTLAGQVPGSVRDLVPMPVALLWSATFALGAAVTLAGVLWRDPLTGWTLEISGRIALSGTSLAYTLALLESSTQWGSAIVIVVIFSIGVSSAWRVYQLVRRLDRFMSDIRLYRSARAPRRKRGDRL